MIRGRKGTRESTVSPYLTCISYNDESLTTTRAGSSGLNVCSNSHKAQGDSTAPCEPLPVSDGRARNVHSHAAWLTVHVCSAYDQAGSGHEEGTYAAGIFQALCISNVIYSAKVTLGWYDNPPLPPPPSPYRPLLSPSLSLPLLSSLPSPSTNVSLPWSKAVK